MIIVTGAAGFIASALVNKLNNKGLKDIVVVDDFSVPFKMKNLEYKSYRLQVHRDELPGWLSKHHHDISFVYHLGARTDTAEFNPDILNRLNLEYSKTVWNLCVQYQIPLVYASSAATYGAGELGYSDDHTIIAELKPLNPYGVSKNEFDKFVLTQDAAPPFWAGLKFFNVYGPNEYHKGRMASVIFHAYHQVISTGRLKLFRSHHHDYLDGMQLRDFVYVKDVVSVCYFFLQQACSSAIYNVGTGRAEPFLSLGRNVFAALNIEPVIDFVDIPEDIREKYQYYTQADITKLRKAGFTHEFFDLRSGIQDYISAYLAGNIYF